MADLIGKIKGKIDQGISKVNVKSKELIEKQKIKLQISELKAEKKIVFLDLGKLTHQMIESFVEPDLALNQGSRISKNNKGSAPDKWEQTVLNVLSAICEGKLQKILFENTDKDFKITAKSLLAEVQKSLPKSEQKGQNLQWLGRVLGKFGIASRKYSKRINKARETVYEFNKGDTVVSLGKVNNIKAEKTTRSKKENYKDLLLSKSREINALEIKIKKLEEKMSKVAK